MKKQYYINLFIILGSLIYIIVNVIYFFLGTTLIVTNKGDFYINDFPNAIGNVHNDGATSLIFMLPLIVLALIFIILGIIDILKLKINNSNSLNQDISRKYSKRILTLAMISYLLYAVLKFFFGKEVTNIGKYIFIFPLLAMLIYVALDIFFYKKTNYHKLAYDMFIYIALMLIYEGYTTPYGMSYIHYMIYNTSASYDALIFMMVMMGMSTLSILMLTLTSFHTFNRSLNIKPGNKYGFLPIFSLVSLGVSLLFAILLYVGAKQINQSLPPSSSYLLETRQYSLHIAFIAIGYVAIFIVSKLKKKKEEELQQVVVTTPTETVTPTEVTQEEVTPKEAAPKVEARPNISSAGISKKKQDEE